MGASHFYYEHDGERVGPFSTAELKQLAVHGRIRPDDYVLTATLDRRVPAAQVKGLFDVATAKQPTAASMEHVSAAAQIPARPRPAPAAGTPSSAGVASEPMTSVTHPGGRRKLALIVGGAVALAAVIAGGTYIAVLMSGDDTIDVASVDTSDVANGAKANDAPAANTSRSAPADISSRDHGAQTETNDFQKSVFPSSEPPPAGMSRLTVIAVPAEADVRIMADEEVHEKAQASIALQSIFSDPNVGAALFNAAFAGPGMKTPLEKVLNPGAYTISIELTDRTSEKADDELGEMFRKKIVPSCSNAWEIQAVRGSGSRRIRFTTHVKCDRGVNKLVLLHMLSTTRPLADTLASLPKHEAVRVDARIAESALKRRDVSSTDLPLVIAMLRRCGIAFLPYGKYGPFMVEVTAEGSLYFTDPKGEAERFVSGLKDVNSKDGVGNTALHTAVAAGQYLVTELIAKGANVNVKGHFDRSPLHNACAQPTVVAILIQNGALVNAKDAHGNTALHLAAEMGKLDTVKLLVKHGADINAVNTFGVTAIARAEAARQREVVTFLRGQKTP